MEMEGGKEGKTDRLGGQLVRVKRKSARAAGSLLGSKKTGKEETKEAKKPDRSQTGERIGREGRNEARRKQEEVRHREAR